GTIVLNCIHGGTGEDDAQFTLGSAVYDINQIIRTKKPGGNCDTETKCANLSVTFSDYENKSGGRVAGFFSGVLYDNKDELSDACESSIPHTVTGEFWLVRAN